MNNVSGVGNHAIDILKERRIIKKGLHFKWNYDTILLMENKCISWANILALNVSIGGTKWLISIMW